MKISNKKCIICGIDINRGRNAKYCIKCFRDVQKISRKKTNDAIQAKKIAERGDRFCTVCGVKLANWRFDYCKVCSKQSQKKAIDKYTNKKMVEFGVESRCSLGLLQRILREKRNYIVEYNKEPSDSELFVYYLNHVDNNKKVSWMRFLKLYNKVEYIKYKANYDALVKHKNDRLLRLSTNRAYATNTFRDMVLKKMEETGTLLDERRSNLLIDYFKNGNTLEVLGRKYDVTRERIRQLIYDGLSKLDLCDDFKSFKQAKRDLHEEYIEIKKIHYGISK
jgi:hypothetical protein